MLIARVIGLGSLAALSLAAVAAAQELGIRPGQWEIAVTVDSIDMPGAPPQIASMMTGKTITTKQCITPEQAARGPQDMLKSSKSCNFTRYSMTGGKLESEMVCNQGGSTITAVSAGSFTPEGFSSKGRSVMSGGSMNMTTTSTAVGRRIGDCKG